MKNDYNEMTENIEMLSVSKMKKWACWRQWLIFPLLIVAMLMNNTMNAQLTQKLGNAPVVYPNGGFAVDGDAFANTQINGIGDWWYGPGTGGSLFDAGGNLILPTNPNVRLNFFEDKYKGDDLPDISVFAQSDKINHNPNTYDVKTGSVPPKDDMQRAIAVFTMGDPTLTTPTYSVEGNASDLWCLFAADRWKVNGASYIDFEFNQASIFVNSDGSMTSEAVETDGDGDLTGGRTTGDILLTLEFTNGGGLGNVWVDTWQKDGQGQEYYWKTIDLTLPANADAIFITPNIVAEDAPWPIYDQPGPPFVYEINQYVEGAINLSKMLLNANKCKPISTVWVRTKSSHSASAQLKDLGGIAQVDIDLSPTVSVNDDTICASDLPGSLTATPSGDNGPFAYEWSGPDGLTPITQTINPVVAGEYTVVVTDANLCTGTNSGTLMIYPVTPNIVDNMTVCAGDEYMWRGVEYTAADSPVVLDLMD